GPLRRPPLRGPQSTLRPRLHRRHHQSPVQRLGRDLPQRDLRRDPRRPTLPSRRDRRDRRRLLPPQRSQGPPRPPLPAPPPTVTPHRHVCACPETVPTPTCAGTIVDPLCHHAEIVEIVGDSYRPKEAKDRRSRRSQRRPPPIP